MRVFIFQSQIWLPKRREEMLPFFADAANLEKLTPPLLHFKILTPQPIPMQEGSRFIGHNDFVAQAFDKGLGDVGKNRRN